jgi:integrase
MPPHGVGFPQGNAGGENVSADAIDLHTSNADSESADFCLTPAEVAKGQQAAATYLESLKAGDARRIAEEALGTLAAVISGGVCDTTSFPWQQVRAYHGALALSIVKERGAPAHIEALRCSQNDTRKFQQVPEAFSPKYLQKMRSSLTGVVRECGNLGFLSEEELELALAPTASSAAGKGSSKTTSRRSASARELTEGEFRALISACNLNPSAAGCRDALMIGLAWEGGLRTVDLVNLSLDDLHFNSRSGKATIRLKQPQGKRARHLPLDNGQLISLEDWLEARGREEGPLFCPIGRGGKIERKRMSASAVKEFCDARAVQAGVLPFAPNDLAKSGSAQGEPARRRKAARSVASPSPLFASETESDTGEGIERIHFPYPLRTGT